MEANFSFAAMVAPALSSSLFLGVWIRYLLRLKLIFSISTSFAVNVILGFYLMMLESQGGTLPPLRARVNSGGGPIYVVALMIAANLTVALLIKVYRAAVLDIAKPAERLTGTAGVRAWLSPLNVIAVIAISVTADLALDYNYFAVAILGLSALLAYPLAETVMQSSRSPESTPLQAPAEERQRVLALVEAGKISAEDAAELLSALAQSQVANIEAATLVTGPRKLIIAGAAVVLLAFFLPWFSINISQAMREAMTTLQQSITGMPQGMPPGMAPALDGLTWTPQLSTNGIASAVPVQSATQITLRGGDLRDGLGWIVLAVALASAGLPSFWTPGRGKAHQLRNATIAALALGSVTLVYLLSNSFNSFTGIEPGFIMAMAGYVLMWIGTMREYFARRSGVPVMTAVV
jgi:hypothetical protein